MGQYPLSESKIQQWVGDVSFRRGEHYHLRRSISHPRRETDTLKALCSGSLPDPYRVEILLGSHGIVAGRCSCPVGEGGRCKHAAALLLTWLHEPHTFQEVDDLETGLERRTKPELVALIRKMVQRYPDLEMLLELPTPAGSDTDDVLDADLIRRQVNVAFSRAGDDGEAAYRASSDLQDLVDFGDEYTRYENWHNAAIVYETLARGILENYDLLDDDQGELSEIVCECIEGLAQCLEAVEGTAQRQGLLRALFDIYRLDVGSGRYGIGNQIADHILSLVNREEGRTVAEWVRTALPEGDSLTDTYHRRAYGGFLLELLNTELDDESFLQICRQTGRLQDLVDRLLDLNRVDEAMVATRGADTYDLLRLADRFVSHGHGRLAKQMVRERAQTSENHRLTDWLKARAEEGGDLAEALTFAEANFWQQPSPPAYMEIERLARELKQWDSVRSACLGRLRAEGNWAILTEIHLLDDEIDQALETLAQYCLQERWGGDTLSLKVARFAEGSRPRHAIRLYLTVAERLIAAGGRRNYAKATNYLLRVRAAHREIGAAEDWETLIANLREKHRRLPAMQDEFDQAGL